MTDLPWPTWHAAVADPRIDAAIRAIYADLDAASAAQSPRCDASGRCCRFEEFGHRLYVTALEIAWVLKETRSNSPSSRAPSPQRYAVGFRDTPTSVELPILPPLTAGLCPYQKNNLCTIHPVRPLGCRIFFCAPGTQDWQNQLYEDYLRRLRQLHDTHALPYAYLEWRAGLHAATDPT